jgi:hypothetical protein
MRGKESDKKYKGMAPPICGGAIPLILFDQLLIIHYSSLSQTASKNKGFT